LPRLAFAASAITSKERGRNRQMRAAERQEAEHDKLHLTGRASYHTEPNLDRCTFQAGTPLGQQLLGQHLPIQHPVGPAYLSLPLDDLRLGGTSPGNWSPPLEENKLPTVRTIHRLRLITEPPGFSGPKSISAAGSGHRAT